MRTEVVLEEEEEEEEEDEEEEKQDKEDGDNDDEVDDACANEVACDCVCPAALAPPAAAQSPPLSSLLLSLSLLVKPPPTGRLATAAPFLSFSMGLSDSTITSLSSSSLSSPHSSLLWRRRLLRLLSTPVAARATDGVTDSTARFLDASRSANDRLPPSSSSEELTSEMQLLIVKSSCGSKCVR